MSTQGGFAADPSNRALLEALRARRLANRKGVQQIPPGMNTNQTGPRPDTTSPANAWPTDGDSSA